MGQKLYWTCMAKCNREHCMWCYIVQIFSVSPSSQHCREIWNMLPSGIRSLRLGWFYLFIYLFIYFSWGKKKKKIWERGLAWRPCSWWSSWSAVWVSCIFRAQWQFFSVTISTFLVGGSSSGLWTMQKSATYLINV